MNADQKERIARQLAWDINGNLLINDASQLLLF